MSKKISFSGLVPAAFTPMLPDGSLNLKQTDLIVERYVKHSIKAAFICGTTGESASLTTAERKATLAAYIASAKGRVGMIAHVGHSSVADSCELAAHAQGAGAVAMSALAPFYFKPANVRDLVECMAQIAAAAPQLPFYYYHIPGLTGVQLDMVEFLKQGQTRIPNLAGIKYTAPTVYEFQSCRAFEQGKFDILFGVDEMLLAGLATGAKGAVGSTYNLAPALYQQIQASLAAGDLATAQRLQLLSAQMVEAVKVYRPLPALKSMMALVGIDCGPSRAPLMPMQATEIAGLKQSLEQLDFLRWMQ